jgi:hypothetical protein
MLDGQGTIPSSYSSRAEKLLREERKLSSKVSCAALCVVAAHSKIIFSLFRVPVGTTPELQNLLYGLLRRNAKERMPFDVFFNHPFLQRHPPAPQQQAAGECPNLSRHSHQHFQTLIPSCS